MIEEQVLTIQSASTEEIEAHLFVLTPGRYVGAEEVEDDGEPFEEKLARLVAKLDEQGCPAQAPARAPARLLLVASR